MYKGNMYAVANAKCPYFMAEFTSSVTCEGICDGSKCVQKFDSESIKDNYIKDHCLNYPNDCLLAQTLDKKYE